MASQKGNAKPTVDTVDENMNEKVERDVDVEKVAKKEKALDKDDVIKVISLIPNVSYKDKKYGDIYQWEKANEIVEMTFDVINYMHQNHKTYFKSMWIKPLDKRVIKKFGLESTYRDYDFLMDASNYTRKNIKEICDSIRNTKQSSLKFAICNKIKSLVSSGEIADIYILREIEKSLNIDLIPLID